MRTRPSLCIAAILFAFNIPTAAQVASGGSYLLEKSVIGGGGGQVSEGNYRVEKTIGQAVAGTTSSGAGYTVTGGFWTAAPIPPTASNATIRGRVTDLSGRGIAGVHVLLMGGTLIAPRGVVTNTFGHFILREIPVGQFYVLTAQSRRYAFSPNSIAFNLVDDLSEIEFQVQ